MRAALRARIAATAAVVLTIGAGAAWADGFERARYLAETCAACHFGGDATAAIPGLAGRSPDDFAVAMRAYRGGERASRIMATVAASLSEADVALLARYFADRPPEDAAR